jgi:hypothetical protein
MRKLQRWKSELEETSQQDQSSSGSLRNRIFSRGAKTDSPDPTDESLQQRLAAVEKKLDAYRGYVADLQVSNQFLIQIFTFFFDIFCSTSFKGTRPEKGR